MLLNITYYYKVIFFLQYWYLTPSIMIRWPNLYNTVDLGELEVEETGQNVWVTRGYYNNKKELDDFELKKFKLTNFDHYGSNVYQHDIRADD